MTSTEPTIDRLARAADCVAQTHGQEGHLRAQSLGDDMAKAIVRAILRELRAFPLTNTMDAMVTAYDRNYGKHGIRETLAAVNRAQIDAILEGR